MEYDIGNGNNSTFIVGFFYQLRNGTVSHCYGAAEVGNSAVTSVQETFDVLLSGDESGGDKTYQWGGSLHTVNDGRFLLVSDNLTSPHHFLLCRHKRRPAHFTPGTYSVKTTRCSVYYHGQNRRFDPHELASCGNCDDAN
jgi:hypothetical protein